MLQAGEVHVSAWQQVLLSGAATKRLLMACAMGGAIGIEREFRHKESGLRTNILICMGSALFTLMSAALVSDANPDKSRVASNIVQGVGFLGAGLILHNRNRVQGLTTAATVFVVAAIGMTCGASMYLEALLATVLVLLALTAVGLLEVKIGWHRYSMLYEVRAEVGATPSEEAVGEDAAKSMSASSEAARRRMYTSILHALDKEGVRLELDTQENIAGLERMTFSVLATRRVHERLLDRLRKCDETDQVLVFRDVEDE